MLGYLMEEKEEAVDNIPQRHQASFNTAIMGGSKVSTKIGIIENLLDKVDETPLSSAAV